MYYYWVIGRGYATKEEFALEDLKMVNSKYRRWLILQMKIWDVNK